MTYEYNCAHVYTWSQGLCSAMARRDVAVAALVGVLAVVHFFCTPPRAQIELLAASPRAWLVRDFLSSAEVDALLVLLDVASDGAVSNECWEHVSRHQATAMIETCPSLAAAPLMRVIDDRVARALNTTRAWLEHGYVQSYTAGYTQHNVHLDQGHAMAPARIASAIIYLDTQPSGSGATIFPLARRAERDASAAQRVAAWNAKLQAGRITSRFFTPDGYGAALFELAQRQCAAGHGVAPVKGTALFFEARLPRGDPGAGGAETIEAVHGSCGLPPGAPAKRVLVKLACDGRVRAVS